MLYRTHLQPFLLVSDIQYDRLTIGYPTIFCFSLGFLTTNENLRLGLCCHHPTKLIIIPPIAPIALRVGLTVVSICGTCTCLHTMGFGYLCINGFTLVTLPHTMDCCMWGTCQLQLQISLVSFSFLTPIRIVLNVDFVSIYPHFKKFLRC